MPITLADGVRGQEPPAKLGFKFRLAGGTGKLTLGRRTFFGWLHLDRLELEVPNLRLPVDLAIGAGGVPAPPDPRPGRLAAHGAGRPRPLRRPARARPRGPRGRGAAHHLRRWRPVRQRPRARVGPGGELTARIYLDADGERLRFACGRALVYGYLPTPAPLIAHRIMAALLGGRPGEVRFDAQATGVQGTGVHAPTGTGVHTAAAGASSEPREHLGPWASSVRGLGDIEIEPLAMTLWHILPSCRLAPAGHPRPGRVRRAGRPGRRWSLSYRAAADPATDPTGPSVRGPGVILLFDTLERLREADERLVCRRHRRRHAPLPRPPGRPPGRRVAAARSPAGGRLGPPRAVRRVRRAGGPRAGPLARLRAPATPRWPASRSRAATTVGAGARYRTLSQVAGASGERESASRAALAAARLLRRAAPDRRRRRCTSGCSSCRRATPRRPTRWSIATPRTALGRPGPPAARPGRPHGRTDRERAVRRRVRRARDHVRAAQVLVGRAGRPGGRARGARAPRRLDPHSPAALEVLADVQAAPASPPPPPRRSSAPPRSTGERRDRRGQSRALVRAAALLDSGRRDRARRGEATARCSSCCPASRPRCAARPRGGRRRGEHAEAARLHARAPGRVTAGSPTDAARDSLELAAATWLAAGDAAEPRGGAGARGAPAAARWWRPMPTSCWPTGRGASGAATRRSISSAAPSRRCRGRRARATPLPAELRARAAEAALEPRRAPGPAGRARRRAGRARARLRAVGRGRPGAAARGPRAGRRRPTRAATATPSATGSRALLAHPERSRSAPSSWSRRAELALEAGEDLAGALADLDRALRAELPATRGRGRCACARTCSARWATRPAARARSSAPSRPPAIR